MRDLDLWTMEEETATTMDKKAMFSLPSWSISGCCGTHLITAARKETKRGMWFTASLPMKIWVQIAHCFPVKNWNDWRHHLQSSASLLQWNYVKHGLNNHGRQGVVSYLFTVMKRNITQLVAICTKRACIFGQRKKSQKLTSYIYLKFVIVYII